MRSFEEVYYETIQDCQELRQQMGNGQMSEMPNGLSGCQQRVWQAAKELEEALCDEDFEETLN